MRPWLRRAHESGQVPNPYAKLAGANALRVVGGVVKDAEDIFDKEICNRKSHAGESPHEELGPVGKVEIEGAAAMCVHPRVVMINPKRIRLSDDPKE
jgi:hypothetical protein